MYESYLEHHGVKGMKWGVRRERKKDMKQRLKNNQEKAKMASKLVNKSMAKSMKKGNEFEDYVKYETEYNRRMDAYNKKSYAEVKKEYQGSKAVKKINKFPLSTTNVLNTVDRTLEKHGKEKLSDVQRKRLKIGYETAATLLINYGAVKAIDFAYYRKVH